MVSTTKHPYTMENQENKVENELNDNQEPTSSTDINTETSKKSAENAAPEHSSQVAELNDKYLRLYSEFDNYRRRTIKEKGDIIRTAAEDVLKSIIPTLDDFERAIKANEKVDDVTALKEGFLLIYNKLKHNTTQKGLVDFESKGKPFDPDTMEAITHLPAPDEATKGHIIDEVEKGYKLGDKVIRFAKVVVAQ